MTVTRSQFLDRVVLLSLVLAALTGCGKKRPETTPIEGVVTFQGKPLTEADVMFAPQQSGWPSTGKTDSQGRFRLTTFQQNDGAVEGEYNVIVAKFASTAASPDAKLAPSGSGRANAPSSLDDQPVAIKWLIPQRYGNAKTSGLSAKVAVGGDELRFDLVP